MSAAQTTTLRPPATPAPRVHGLDALRAGALWLGIVLHGLLPFVPGMPWVVDEQQKSQVAGVATLWIHMFRMPLFMFLAGYFARMSLGRRGTRGFIADRLKRIAAPLAVFAPLMLVLVVALAMWAGVRAGVSLAPPESGQPPSLLLMLSPGHLWFLWSLLQLYAIFLVLRLVFARVPGADRLGAWLGDLLSRPGGVLLPALTYLAAMELTKKAIGGPTTLVPELPATIAFVGAFGAGWLCWGRAEALPRLQRLWPVHLVAAALATGLVVTRLGAAINMEAFIEPWWLRAGYALAVWLWTFGLIGLCVAVLPTQRPVVRYLADSSYWVYIVHLPVVLLVQVLLYGAALPIVVKVVLIVAAGTLVPLLSYDLFVRSTWLGAWLNGRRYPRVLARRTPETGGEPR